VTGPLQLLIQVQRIPFEDHGPPLMTEMIYFCEEASRWLLASESNCIAVHCKGGKGRTGVMIAALMLWCGHRRCAMDAMELFTFRRTANYDPDKGFGDARPDDADLIAGSLHRKLMWILSAGLEDKKNHMPNQGPEGPSQIRYVHYLEAMLYSGIDPLNFCKRFLSHISLPVCSSQLRDPWFLSFSVRCMRGVVYDSGRHLDKATIVGGDRASVGQVIKLLSNVVIFGDTRVDFFLHKSPEGVTDSNRKLAFFVCFNTAFYESESHLTFKKHKVDMLHKMTKIDTDYQVTFNLDQVHSSPSSQSPTENLYFHQLYRQRNMLHESFFNIFLLYGERRSFAPGDIVLHERTDERVLMYVSSGAVQGVINEICDANHQYHPMGLNGLFPLSTLSQFFSFSLHLSIPCRLPR
jgi:hypothetical protein